MDSDSLAANLAIRYPDRPPAEMDHVADLARELTRSGYESFEQVEAHLEAAHEGALAYERDHPPSSPDGRFGAVGIARMALSVANPEYARSRGPDVYGSYRAMLTGQSSGSGSLPAAPPLQPAAPPMRPVPSRGADADAFIEFLRTGVDRLYHGKWQDFSGGFGTAIEVDGLGIHLLHHEDNVGFAAGILSGVEFSADLVRTVSKISCGSAMGALTLREGQPGHWSLTWGMKTHRRWLDPASRGTAQLVLDVLTFIPEYVPMVAEDIQPRFGGRRFGTSPGWWPVLLEMY